MYFIHDSINYKLRKDFSTWNEDYDKKSKNTLISCVYRPPAGKLKPFKSYLKDIFRKNERLQKSLYFIGDFNLNVLDYETNTKVKHFFNLLFQHGLIPVINKQTRAKNKSITAIDHIITNTFLKSKISAGILKIDITDHFPILLMTHETSIDSCGKEKVIYKKKINSTIINNFKIKLRDSDWGYINYLQCPNQAYDKFMQKFTPLYEKFS